MMFTVPINGVEEDNCRRMDNPLPKITVGSFNPVVREQQININKQ